MSDVSPYLATRRLDSRRAVLKYLLSYRIPVPRISFRPTRRLNYHAADGRES